MKLSSEPAVLIGTIGAVAGAIIALLVAFNLPITQEQQEAILGLVAVVTPLVVGIVTRNFVTPVKDNEDPNPEG